MDKLTMTYQELESEVNEALKTKQKCLRKGQFVFNYLYKKYPVVVEAVQFEDRVDCYYVDERIEDFIAHVVKRINEMYYEIG